MPFGKSSQQPVPKPHMVKTHKGLGNHKTVLHTHAAVRGNTNLQVAPSGQPNRAGKTGGAGTPA
jgi:hypothetical protein